MTTNESAQHGDHHAAPRDDAGEAHDRPSSTGEDDTASVVTLDQARSRRSDAQGEAVAGNGDQPSTRVLVDSGDTASGQPRWARLSEARRRPILPPWLRSFTDARTTAAWAARLAVHTAVYHLVRVPKYLGRMVAQSPRGSWRLATRYSGWISDSESEPLRQYCARQEDTEAYLKLSRIRDQHVRGRGLLTATATPFVAIGVTVAVWLAPAWTLWASAAVLILVLGVVGRPGDQPLVDRAVTIPQAPRLTSDVVIRALGSLGISEINKALKRGEGNHWFPSQIMRDGPGFRAEVDLPFGVTVSHILDKREEIASGLRRPVGCVWPEKAPNEHAGRLVLWVGDKTLAATKTPAWPLAKSGRTDIFGELPFAFDQRLKTIAIQLMFNNILIGAMPRSGKTATLLILLLAAALDPRVELRVFELKGTGDLESLAKVAHHYASGSDEATLRATVDSLREIHAELERRAKVINKLPRHQCPEYKVTPELAERRSLGLWPIVFNLDEAQELFTHPEYGPQAAQLCEPIIKRGPALGIILMIATQIPDKDSLPKSISRNMGIRFCLRVMDHTANDMVLGTSMHQNGYRANNFTPSDQGVGWLVGATDDPIVVKTAFLDGVQADRITGRARALRERDGTLTGHALGESTDLDHAKVRYDLLDDIASVCPVDGGEESRADGKYWSSTIIELLAEYRPGVYERWSVDQLATALAPHGVTTSQIGRRVDGKTINRRGIDVHDIHEAITRRDRRGEAA